MTTPLKKLDISTLTEALGALAIREEKPEEMEARLAREAADGNHARWKDKWLFIACGLIGLVVLFVCLPLSIWGTDADTRRWAQSVVIAMVAGVVGWLVGRK